MDWINFTRDEVENDVLPNICMECGAPATCRVNKTFSYTPEWVGWLALPGILPAIIASIFLEKKMRVSCPFCDPHGNLWRRLPWKIRWGWLVVPAAITVGALACLAVGSREAAVLGGLVGAVVGAMAWGIWVAIPFRRVKVRKITKEEISFEGLAAAFVEAAKQKRTSAQATG